MEPITREEMFLSDIAGESNFDLEPITRTEKFLDKIAKSGGGGGGGVSSWNDLKGTIPQEKLPEGYPYAEEEVLTMVEEGKYTSYLKEDYGAFVLDFSYAFENIPQKITVSYDGNVYTNLQVTFINDSLGYLAGNLSLMNSIMGTSFPNTGEPFFVGISKLGLTVFVPDTAPTEHTVGVWEQSEIIIKLDPKFLPDMGYVVSGVVNSENENDSLIVVRVQDTEILDAYKSGIPIYMEDVISEFETRRSPYYWANLFEQDGMFNLTFYFYWRSANQDTITVSFRNFDLPSD